MCWTRHCFHGKRLLALAGAGAVCNATTKNAETVLHIYFNYNVLNNDGEHLSLFTHRSVECDRKFKEQPDGGFGCSSGVTDAGKLTGWPFVLGTSRCV